MEPNGTEMLVYVMPPEVLRKHVSDQWIVLFVCVLSQVHSILTVVGAQPLFVVDEGKLVGLITWPEVMTDGFNIKCLLTGSFAVNSVKLFF